MEDAFKLDEIFDVNSFETVETSPVSYVTRARFRRTQAEPVAIKSASVLQEFSKKPHDIVKELRLLKSVSHINIIDVLDYTFDPSSRLIHFWMPFIPWSLDRLLSSPTFTPRSLRNISLRTTLIHGTSPFIVLAKSLIYQIIIAVAYLHEHDISHRDIKPRNIMLSLDGCVKLIDLGVAWKSPTNASAENGLWPEPPGEMCFDVATGPYRAPELLFGATSYDASATDLWSLGALCAEFYTSLRLHRQCAEDDSDSDSDSDEHDIAKKPLIITRGLSVTSTDVVWTRDSLFDSRRGAIGLAWSIFKILGTPTEENWPTFKALPDAAKVIFQEVAPTDFQNLLPNLPSGGQQPQDRSSGDHLRRSCLDLIQRFLIYDPSRRMRPAVAISHPFFVQGEPLLLPEGYSAGELDGQQVKLWKDKSLGELLAAHLEASVTDVG